MSALVKLNPCDPHGKRPRPSPRLIFDASLRSYWTDQVEALMPYSEPPETWSVRPPRERPQRDWLALEFTATLYSRPSARAQDVVYFIDCGPYTKIGTTCDIRTRISGFEGHNPFPLSLWGLIPGDVKLERQLHRDLADRRFRKEWFLLDEQTKAEIRDWLLEHDGEFYGEDKWMRPVPPTSVPITQQGASP